MKSNTIIIIVASLIVAGGAYWYFFTDTGNEQPITTAEPLSLAQVEFETLESQLPISFNTDIFSDPRFSALVDISVPISPEPIGRTDPLAPISGVSSAPQ